MDMSLTQFKRLATEYPTVPVYKQILADLLTPISAYLSLSQNEHYSFLLESVEKGTQYSRYSYLGRNPLKILNYSQNCTTLWENGRKKSLPDSPVKALRKLHKKYRAPRLPGMPAFTGGWVGFMGYEAVTLYEDVPIHPDDELHVPDMSFMLFEEIVVFDHLKNRIILFSNVNINPNTDLEKEYHTANARIDVMGEDLHSDIDYQTPIRTNRSELGVNIDRSAFESMVEKARKYIAAGDIFQVVISQRFHRNTSAEPLTLYRALRSINPSPYMFHIKLNGWDIIGASPELLVKVADRVVEIRPIAGTRPRGDNKTEDEKNAGDLLADEKECAEHLMLVDLGRNDVGRVAVYDTVSVKDFMLVEYYSHVMHIVSDIRGKLQPDMDVLDALLAGFPAGTLTGAPKIRAMEIIHELETSRRSVYGGAVGYLDFCGNMTTAIAIRTMLMKDGVVYFQSGAGIVHDSDPAKEYQETVSKARAVMQAIDFAENGLTNGKGETS